MLKWKVILLDNRPGHSRDEVDVTAYVHLDKSTFQPTEQGLAKPSTLWIDFRADTTGLVVQEGMEFWAGMRDDITNEWSDAHPVYGGYIGEQTGRSTGDRHIIEVQTDEYSVDLDTAHILFWPDPATPGSGITPGLSATDWLVGDPMSGMSFGGLITQRLAGGPGVDLTGVDSAFDSIIFDAAAMPGLGTKEHPTDRYYGYCMLREALDNVIEVIKFYANEMDPVAYMEPVVDSTDATRLRPRFRLVNRASTAGSVWAAYNITPGVGEYKIFNELMSFGHTRDNREARQRIIVKGAGLEAGAYVAGETYDSSRDIQRTVYLTDPGRVLLLQSDDLGVTADCQQLSDNYESLMYGGVGRLEVPVDFYAPPGAIVTLTIPQEGQSATRYRVNESTPISGKQIGHPMWILTVGAERPDLGNLFPRQVRYLSGVRQLQKLGLKPGGVPSSPIYSNPGHSQQNVQQAQNDTTTARTTKPGYVRTGETRTTDYIMREQDLDPTGTPRNWKHDATGTDHPHHYGGLVTATSTIPILGAPTDNGLARIQIADDGVRLARITIRMDDGGDGYGGGVWHLYQNNTEILLADWPTPTAPIATARGDVWKLAAESLGGGISLPLTVIFSEAG